MTGNNVAVSTELARRCVRMRLTPHTDRPEERTDFRHADLLLWCAEHRAELVRAAHVIIKWWVQQGMPPAKNPRPLGSYERWTRVIGGILEAAGYQKFLANYREFQAKADTERVARALFCATWYDWSQMEAGRETAVTAQLIAIAEGIEGLPIKGSTERALQTSLGIWLRANADVIVEHSEDLDSERTMVRHFRSVAGKSKAGKQPWIIEKLFEEVHEVHGTG
jgi:putative DNA primase/helicase